MTSEKIEERPSQVLQGALREAEAGVRRACPPTVPGTQPPARSSHRLSIAAPCTARHDRPTGAQQLSKAQRHAVQFPSENVTDGKELRTEPRLVRRVGRLHALTARLRALRHCKDNRK